jgi:hypothetical protein
MGTTLCLLLASYVAGDVPPAASAPTTAPCCATCTEPKKDLPPWVQGQAGLLDGWRRRRASECDAPSWSFGAFFRRLCGKGNDSTACGDAGHDCSAGVK